MIRIASFTLAVLAAAALAFAHPHFNKTVSTSINDVEVSVSYNSTDANMERVAAVEAGTFVSPRGPRLNISGDVMAGDMTIAAGEYTIGVIKGADGAWTMALHEGRIPRGEMPDMGKVMKLDSRYSDQMGTADHMLIDITAGSGDFAGKPVLTIHFGNMHLQAAIG
jgi:hypothetical protein